MRILLALTVSIIFTGCLPTTYNLGYTDAQGRSINGGFAIAGNTPLKPVSGLAK
jgi:hypothetical protein